MTDDARPSIQFSIPDVPYSAVRVTVLDDSEAAAAEMVRVLHVAAWFREKFLATFPEPEPEARRERPPPPQQTPRGNAVAYCPEHDMAPMQASARQYNPDGDKFYHALTQPVMRDGKRVNNHTLWWRLTVDADGNSNEGNAIPSAPPQRRPAGAGHQDEEQPPYEDFPPF